MNFCIYKKLFHILNDQLHHRNGFGLTIKSKSKIKSSSIKSEKQLN